MNTELIFESEKVQFTTSGTWHMDGDEIILTILDEKDSNVNYHAVQTSGNNNGNNVNNLGLTLGLSIGIPLVVIAAGVIVFIIIKKKKKVVNQ